MRKGFTRKPRADEPATPVKNYITPSGLQRLKEEHRFLLTRERPAVTEVVAWAASNGDRVKTPTISTASGGCGRSTGGFAFSRSESKPRKWWTRKLRERGSRPENCQPMQTNRRTDVQSTVGVCQSGLTEQRVDFDGLGSKENSPESGSLVAGSQRAEPCRVLSHCFK
jgi:hypothetical protein